MKRESYAVRQAKAKRLSAEKSRAVARVAAAIEMLWKSAIAESSAFTEQERESIADASYSIRSIEGGWVNYRKVRR